ncbi:MAG: nucleotidyltransferase domain-containing protein [Chloroflexi bacterium]|nr:MAG: nucleotidyltransferase domain-containing protein [Chloroflexota bacterium]
MRTVVINGVALEPRTDLHRRKLEALKSFVAYLRRRHLQDGIAKVILIGSVLEGNVSAESDVDLVVFGVGDLQSVRTLCAEVAFETGLDTGESVQPIVYPLNSYYHPTTSFLKRAINEGRIIYSMNETDLKRHLLDGKHRLASS